MTQDRLLTLLREAESAIVAALYGETDSATATLNRIARALSAAAADGRCQSCGKELSQAATGRPKLYCGEACKKRAYRARRSA